MDNSDCRVAHKPHRAPLRWILAVKFHTKRRGTLAKRKKADIASEAERLADGTGWMPAIFKAEGPQQAVRESAQEAGPEQDAPEDAEARADEPAEALAA